MHYTRITGPITVSKSTNIKTYAVDAAGNHASDTYSYVIETGGVGDGYLVDAYGATGISIYFNPGTWSAARFTTSMYCQQVPMPIPPGLVPT